MSITDTLNPPAKLSTALAPYGSPDDVNALAVRLQDFMSGGHRLTPVEARALANAAVMYGLDPFLGEIWYLKDRDGKPLGLMAGIKGHRSAARRQIEQEGGGNYWTDFEPILPQSFKALGIPDGAVAFRCRLYDTQTLNNFVNQVERLFKVSPQMTWDIVRGLLGDRPFHEGVGYWKPGEFTKMTPVQVSMKRAEADALKRRFHLPFGEALAAEDGDVVEGEYSLNPEPGAGPSAAHPNHAAGLEALYGAPDQPAAEEPADQTEPAAAQTESQPPEPAPEAEHRGNGGAQRAAPRPTATIKCRTQTFERLAAELAAAHPALYKTAGIPDRFRILADAHALGFKSLDNANVESVFEQLAERARGEAEALAE